MGLSFLLLVLWISGRDNIPTYAKTIGIEINEILHELTSIIRWRARQ